MRTLRFRPAARRDIVEITRYIAKRSSVKIAKKVREELLAECLRLAALKTMRGRSRAELRDGLRSVPHRPYIIFLAYPDENTVEIVRVVHGARDLPALFESGED